MADALKAAESFGLVDPRCVQPGQLVRASARLRPLTGGLQAEALESLESLLEGKAMALASMAQVCSTPLRSDAAEIVPQVDSQVDVL